MREGGAFYEKIHLGTYLLLLLLPVALFSRPVFLRGEEIVRFRCCKPEGVQDRGGPSSPLAPAAYCPPRSWLAREYAATAVPS